MHHLLKGVPPVAPLSQGSQGKGTMADASCFRALFKGTQPSGAQPAGAQPPGASGAGQQKKDIVKKKGSLHPRKVEFQVVSPTEYKPKVVQHDHKFIALAPLYKVSWKGEDLAGHFLLIKRLSEWRTSGSGKAKKKSDSGWFDDMVASIVQTQRKQGIRAETRCVLTESLTWLKKSFYNKLVAARKTNGGESESDADDSPRMAWQRRGDHPQQPKVMGLCFENDLEVTVVNNAHQLLLMVDGKTITFAENYLIPLIQQVAANIAHSKALRGDGLRIPEKVRLLEDEQSALPASSSPAAFVIKVDDCSTIRDKVHWVPQQQRFEVHWKVQDGRRFSHIFPVDKKKGDGPEGFDEERKRAYNSACEHWNKNDLTKRHRIDLGPKLLAVAEKTA